MNIPRIVFCRLFPFAIYVVLLALDSTLVQFLEAMQGNAKWSYDIRVGIIAAHAVTNDLLGVWVLWSHQWSYW